VLVVRAVCPPAAGPLEDYAAGFDELFSRMAQRRGFREYLTGLLAPRDRNKTLTGLAGAEPAEGRSTLRCNGCSTSCRSPHGMPMRSTGGVSSCWSTIRRPRRMHVG
jgi:hypothetical protein